MRADRRKHREALNMLLEKASIQGYLTTDDLMECYPEVVEDAECLSVVMLSLRNRGVEVVDPEAEPAIAEPPQGWDGWNPEGQAEALDSSDGDSVGMYLKEMSRVPLLSVEEEYDLAVRIEEGRKARAGLLCGKRLGRKERDHFNTLVQDGLAARDHLIKANTRLVVSVAKRYVGHGVPFLDLIQEGNLGLMKAVEKYDVHRGFRFSTYATWWIRQTITRSIADQSRTIRLPVHISDRIRQMYKTTHELEQRLGRVPTPQELAQELNLDPKRLEWVLRASWVPLSLESPIGDEDDSELGMFIEDTLSPTPIQSAYQSMLREKVEEVLGTLTPREARVLLAEVLITGPSAAGFVLP